MVKTILVLAASPVDQGKLRLDVEVREIAEGLQRCKYRDQIKLESRWAEPLLKTALSLLQKLLGEDHPNVAQSYNNLALLYSDQGRYAEAELLYQTALSLRQRLLGEDHPDVASSYNNLAGLYFSQGRYAEAEPLYQTALAIAERSLGVNHPHTITTRENLQLLRDNYNSP